MPSLTDTATDARCDCATAHGVRCKLEGLFEVDTGGARRRLCFRHWDALNKGHVVRYAAPARPARTVQP